MPPSECKKAERDEPVFDMGGKVGLFADPRARYGAREHSLRPGAELLAPSKDITTGAATDGCDLRA